MRALVHPSFRVVELDRFRHVVHDLLSSHVRAPPVFGGFPNADAVDPGRHLRAPFEGTELPVHDEKDLLRDVMNVAFGYSEPTKRAPHALHMRLEEGFEAQRLRSDREPGRGRGRRGAHGASFSSAAPGGTDAAMQGEGLEDPADACGGFGRSCKDGCVIGKSACMLGPNVCIPRTDRMVNGLRCGNVDCPERYPVCMRFRDLDGGVCVTEAERACVCGSSSGDEHFVCNE